MAKDHDANNRKNLYEDMFLTYLNEIKDKPWLDKQYESESLILKREIVEQYFKGSQSVFRVVSNSMLKIGRYRVREKLKKGWICGKYMSVVKSDLERFVRALFFEDELSELIICCSENECLSVHQNEIIRLLLHRVPHLIVHRRYIMEDF